MHLLRKRNLRWMAAVLVVVITAGSFIVYRQVGQAATATATPAVQTATVRQGDLAIYASGSGTLVAQQQVSLGFDETSTLSDLLVHVGDTVKTGQMLARADAAAAQEKLDQAERTLRELTSPAAVAAAQLAVADAQEAFEKAQRTYNVNQEGHRATAETLKAAKAKLAVAREAMESAKDEYDSIKGNTSENPQKAAAYLRYVNALNAYNTALATYNWYTGHPSDIEQSQLAADLSLAQANLEEAQYLLAALTGDAVPDDAYGAGLTAVQDARQAVETARKNLADTELIAPIDGIVLSVDGIVGQAVSGTVITLASVSPRMLEVSLDQTDFDKVHVDDQADIVFDALPDITFTGHVTQVDPSLSSGGIVSTIRTMVQMDDASNGEAERLLLGMSAAVDVISGRATAATLVPVEALRELSAGEYAVFVMVNGTPTLTPVQVGLMDVTYAQILSGVVPGDVVTTGLVKTE